jgi:phytoene synthase
MSMPNQAQLDQSWAHCHAVTQQRARNFYYGMKLTPEPKRSAMYAIYAWMRQADDLADEAGDAAEKVKTIDAFRADTLVAVDPQAEALPDGEIWPAVRATVIGHGIPHEYLHAMLDGQLVDQDRTRYHTFEELYDYCYKVASVVGLTCIEVWGYDGGAETRQLAEWRGVAFQLTNILRDVVEDAERDRVYLPSEMFDVYELNPAMFTLSGDQQDVVKGLGRVAERAVEYYRKSAPLDALVHRDGRPCLWAMTRIYRGLLTKIARDPGCVLRKRVRLSSLRKGLIALGATLRR